MYIELHARSAFSFLEGASVPEELASTCASFDSPAMALLDRDSMSGAPRFHLAAKKLGIRALIGAEITSTEGCRYALLAENRTGYQNLCRLITRMKLRTDKHGKNAAAAASPEEIAEHAKGLIYLTGGDEGPLAKSLANGVEEARGCLERLAGMFQTRNVYAEVQRHFHRDQEARNQAIVELARGAGLPLLATNGVCHATPQQREILDVLTCVHHKTAIREAGRLLAKNAERHLKRPAEMEALFSDLPEAIANTSELASRLNFTLADLGYQFPRYPVPPGETMNSYLRKRTEEGARRRYQPYYERARLQVDRELALIEKLNLAGYFLIVWDIVEYCRTQGILVQGRGSAANSAVCYSLGITAVDPVGMDLLFERFLSEERGEWPDIDLDLPSGDRRERAIQYVYQRYGKLGAAMTANIITYRGRSAVRDLGKVLGFTNDELKRLSSLVQTFEWKDPKDTSERQFREAGFDLTHPRIQRFFNLFVDVQDLPRHLGQHSGGMVICQGQLDSVVPLEPATMPGRIVVQWDKDDCADMGIVKVDLLGLGMMAVVEESIDLIRDAFGEEVDLAHLPPDDPKVYGALQKADTIGWFQVESRAQMSCLPRLKPKIFYDIVVQVAIIRPGPIVGQMLNPYLRRRQGLEKVDCMHSALEPVLARTLGVPLFQEQLLRMAMVVAGFSGGEAEELRRAFGFKRSEKRMREVEVKLRHGMDQNGIAHHLQDAIVQSITSFALYGFPESHAASFALLAYASGYLKCHYLAAFTAAMLNNQPMGFYHSSTLIKDAQRHGLHFKPIDVTRSQYACTIEEVEGQKCVRLGLNYLKGLREVAARALVAERTKASFKSLQDLTRRVPELRKEELVKLAEAGALNPLPKVEMHRREALWQSELAIRPVGPLLESVSDEEASSPLAPMTAVECVNADFRNTGLTIGRHPMAFHRERMKEIGVICAARVKTMRHGVHVRIAGCVITRQRPGTAKGFVFLSLEDETGIVNAILAPDVFDQHRLTVVREPYLLVEGMLQNQQGVISVKAQRIAPLTIEEAAAQSHDFH